MRTTLPSRDFNRDPTKAKKAADDGPVFISNHGKPQYVLMNISDYYEITGGVGNIVDLIAMEGDVEFEPPKIDSMLFKPENFA